MGAPHGNRNAAGKHTMGLNKRQKKQVKKFHAGNRRQKNAYAKRLKNFYK
jgi:hypothetical protein